MKHADSDPVRFGYSSSRNISFRSQQEGEELGFTWGEWRAKAREERTEILTDQLYELVNIWIEEDEE